MISSNDGNTENSSGSLVYMVSRSIAMDMLKLAAISISSTPGGSGTIIIATTNITNIDTMLLLALPNIKLPP